MTSIIEAKNLSRFYEVRRGLFAEPATVRALSEASFTVTEGKTLAVVGESGCGKSTLARLLTMIEPPTDGELVIDGRKLGEADSKELTELRKTVQIVFQNPYGSLNPRQKIGSILEEPLKINTKMPARERREKAFDMLIRVGLRPEHYARYPHMFSGGQRQRIAIARALMLDPKILILDEPVSALDVSIQAQVLNILADLQEEFGLTYIFISHDLSVVRFVADEVMVMYLGRPVEFAPVKAAFDKPLHPYTVALLSATPVADPRRKRQNIKLEGELPSPINPPSGCPFHPRCRYARDKCSDIRPEMTLHGETWVACHGIADGWIDYSAEPPPDATVPVESLPGDAPDEPGGAVKAPGPSSPL